MRRTKDGGCDYSQTDDTSNDSATAANTGSHNKNDVAPGYQVVEMNKQEGASAVNTTIDRNKAVNCLTDIYGTQLKDDDAPVSLAESEWKVDQTAEKLLHLALSSHQDTDISTVCTSNSDGQNKSLKLDLATAKLTPQSGDPAVLPLLSPKTPHVVSEFLQYGESTTSETLQPAMDALGRFGETSSVTYLDPSSETFPGSPGSVIEPSTPHGIGLTPVAGGPATGSLFVSTQQGSDGPGLSTIIEHQRIESLSPSSQGEGHLSSLTCNSGPSLIQEQAVSPSAMSAAFPQRVMSLTVSNMASVDNNGGSQNKAQAHMAQKQRGSRKKTLSLNPEEREALENLIEDVIIGGVASDESSNCSDSDDDGQLRDGAAGAGSKEGMLNKEGLPKIYPAQLKVAVKHMRNLPPRFIKRLENAQKKIDAAERIEAERAREEQARLQLEAKEKEQERLKSREDQKREKKKEIRNLLDDLDQYTDEQSVLQNKDREHSADDPSNEIESHKNILTKQTKEVEDFMESTQPVHIGLSKAQNSQGVLSQQDFTKKHLPCQNSTVPGCLPTGKVMNCEDLERELLNRIDYDVQSSISRFGNNQQTELGVGGNSVPRNIHGYSFAGSQNPCDMADRRTFLSADAPEFVPLNFLSCGQQSSTQNVQSAAIHMQAPDLQAQSSVSTNHGQAAHLLLSSPNIHDTKYRPLPKDSSPSVCIEMLQTNASSQYSHSPVSRMSPQVVSNHSSRSSPQLVPASGGDGSAPLPPASQPVGKLPAFMVPKVPTTVPLHQPSAPASAIPQHQGIAGVIPVNPYQLPYNYAAAAFPPQQGFAYQPFFPPASYVPWNESGAEKLGPRGLIGPHPLIGVPLKASPQMARKRGMPHTLQRPGGTPIRHSPAQVNKAPANDVKVLNAESAKKLLLELFEEGKKVLVLLRGCPGSGKSTLAKEITFDGTILSTDDYYLNSQGIYEYDKATLGDAHSWNQNRAKQAMEAGTNPVIIDNTNTQLWEMKSYAKMAQKYGYHIEIIEPNTPWRQNVKELAKRNIHGVSLNSIRRMLDLYEHNVTLQKIIGVQTPTEKQAVVETQQQTQSDGEQQGEKTPRKRRRKKRKRKRHRSKKDKGGSLQDIEKHSSGESSEEDDSLEKNTDSLIRLLEKRASLTSNETTTSPRETTPELMEKSDLWENTFSDIKEDSQLEQDRAPTALELPPEQQFADKGSCCMVEGEALERENDHTDVNNLPEEHYSAGASVLDAGIKNQDSHPVVDSLITVRCNTVECGSSAGQTNEDSASGDICDKESHVLAGVFTTQEVSYDLPKIGSIASNDDTSEIGNVVAAVIDELLSLVESGISDTLQRQNCALTCPDIFANSVSDTAGDGSSKNSVNDFTCVSHETNISMNSCDQPVSGKTASVCLNSVMPSDNTPSESLATDDAVNPIGDLQQKKLELKQKITNCIQEKLLQTLTEQDLISTVDDAEEYLEHDSSGSKTPSLPPDIIMSESDEAEEMHPTTLDDLKKALEDLNFDNPALDNDSDIELDLEYGLEAVGTSLKIQDREVDITQKSSSEERVPAVTGEENIAVSKSEITEETSVSQQERGEQPFNNESRKSNIYTDGETKGVCNSTSSGEKCNYENGFSEEVVECHSEKQKTEVQYWMNRGTDAYCIPLADNDSAYPVINSGEKDYKSDKTSDGMDAQNFLPAVSSLIEPKPKRERKGKRWTVRKTRLDNDHASNSGMAAVDVWDSSYNPDVKNDLVLNNEGEAALQDNGLREACSDPVSLASSACCEAEHSQQTEYSNVVVNSMNSDKTSMDDYKVPVCDQGVTERSLTIGDSSVTPDIIGKMCNTQETSSVTVSGSQTDPRDMVFVDKLRQSDTDAVLVMNEFNIQGILETRPRHIYVQGEVDVVTSCSSNQTWICTVHRSSQTEEIPELINDQQLQDKVIMLQVCFPNLSKEDAEHILEQCQGDMEWASNILLDGSPECSSLSEKTDKPEANSQMCNVSDVIRERSPPNECEVDSVLQDPESLVAICRKLLVHHDGQAANDGILQDNDKVIPQQGDVPLSCSVPDQQSKPPSIQPLCMPCPAALGQVNTCLTAIQEDHVATAKSHSSDRVVLKMSKEFAEQLLQLFGPLENIASASTLTDDSLNVALEKKTAKEIYRCWRDTLDQKLTASAERDNCTGTVSEDEALARCLQEEEYRLAGSAGIQTNSLELRDQSVRRKTKKRKARSPFSSPSSQSSGAASPTKGHIPMDLNMSDRSLSPGKSAGPTINRQQNSVPNLREIMNEEMALEASIAEYLNCQNDVQTNKDTLCTRLNWQKLIERFPKVDEVMLYDVFQSTGFHMDSTISAIERSLSLQGPPKTVMTKEAAQQMDQLMFQQAVEESLKMWPDGEKTPTKEDLYQTIGEPQYSDFRAEAYEHYRKCQECLQKAAEAYRKGMLPVASYYSQQGQLHYEKLKDANHRTTEMIISYKTEEVGKTNSIDLHGLHVDEALKALETVLATREIEQREKPDKRKRHLMVITGRGTHSRGGIARIRPAVIEFLKRNHYSFAEISPSVIKVHLKYRDPHKL